MAHEENYEDPQPENFLEMEAETAYAWEYHEEIAYQERLAISYPRDAAVIIAQNWLEEEVNVKPAIPPFASNFAGGRVCDCGHRDVQHISSGFCDTCNCSDFTTPLIRWERACQPC